MAFENAYAIQGGTYPAEIQRLANSAIAPEVSGVVGVFDLQVRGLGAQGVSVDPGAAIIENVYALAAFRQSYLATNNAADDDAILSVPASTGASPRVDYVVLRIYDPQYAGQDMGPAGKGCGLVLTSSIPTSYPCLPLAKITQPAGNTAGIQQSMVTDLRVVAAPRQQQRTIALPALGIDTDMKLTATDADGEYFPNGLNNTLGPADIDIPIWAVRVQVECYWLGVLYDGGHSPFGKYWVEWGDSTGTSTRDKSTQKFRFDSPGGNNERVNWILADDRPVPAKYRGKTVRFAPKATLDGDTGVSMDALSGMLWRFTFVEQADPEVTERP